MSDLLFDIPEQKSPRLLWLEKHGITTNNNGQNYKPGDECPETGCQLYPWLATTGEFTKGIYSDHNTAWAFSEDEAITQLALKLGIKLWNEEGGQP